MKTFLIVMSLAGPAPESIREMPGALSCRVAVARLRVAAEDPLKGRVFCQLARKDYE
jgi:hypothetical protein